MATTLSGLVLYIPLTFYQVRWACYAETLGILPLTMLLAVLLPKLAVLQVAFLRTLLRVGIIVLFCVGSFLLPAELSTVTDHNQASAESAYIVSDYRNALSFLGHFPPGTVLGNIDIGPAILYYTNHQVIATPYHRNSAGMLFYFAVMTTATDADAYRQLLSRNVDYIVIFPGSTELEPAARPRDDIFYNRLAAGKYPSWLRPLSLAGGPTGGFAIFAVTKPDSTEGTAGH